MSRITLKTIARETGLSITTVSRALAGYNDVSPGTKQLIQETADRLGYYPNLTARQLQSSSTRTVGLILPPADPSFADPYFNLILSGIGDGLAPFGYDLLVSAPGPMEQEIENYRRMVEGGRVDGLVIVRTQQQDPRIAYLINTHFPFVVFGRTNLECDYVFIDENGEEGTYQLVKHLIDLGHRRIAYIAAPLEFMFAELRLTGYRRALEEAGLQMGGVEQGDLTQEGGAEAARHLLGRQEPPTAIVAANDLMAIGLMEVAQQAGLEIGSGLSVAGFDDIPSSKFLRLTTLRQPIYEIGQQLSTMLVAVMQGDDLAERKVILEPELMLRDSTGSPRA